MLEEEPSQLSPWMGTGRGIHSCTQEAPGGGRPARTSQGDRSSVKPQGTSRVLWDTFQAIGLVWFKMKCKLKKLL